MPELTDTERATLMADPRVLQLVIEATVEAEIRGYQMGQAAGHDATKHGYEAGYKDGHAIGFTNGYRTHQEEVEDAWAAVAPTNDQLRQQHQAWIAAGPPEDPAAPDLRPHEAQWIGTHTTEAL